MNNTKSFALLKREMVDQPCTLNMIFKMAPGLISRGLSSAMVSYHVHKGGRGNIFLGGNYLVTLAVTMGTKLIEVYDMIYMSYFNTRH